MLGSVAVKSVYQITSSLFAEIWYILKNRGHRYIKSLNKIKAKICNNTKLFLLFIVIVMPHQV